jgi:hypothetical protein
MSERAESALRSEQATDLETALQVAHDHARMYGLWDIADDLGQIMRTMQARGGEAQMPAIFRGRPWLRRRP